MKKLSVVEIAVVIFAIVTLIIYLVPHFSLNNEGKISSQIKADNAVFTSKIIEEFSANKNLLPSIASKKVTEELNKIQKNPFNKGENLYILSKDELGYSNVEYDDNLKMIIVTTIDNNNSIIARTVINPPSFVTYYKDDNKEASN